ncbi:GGDEF domain-containing protein [Mycolicibacterium sp. 050158]|uniref:GGDEF domain-containing protein n=1 Tax=Mycolicibacterium sp. 050158 TaxID=3090602 RepID=UPI00299E1E64|nr:GGDEF domain-containing protein [Mycolicibacterium sp. 050158]MDX1889306.1 GGDEF domain-containing protein [Mycolicibacterium sp. 050158]
MHFLSSLAGARSGDFGKQRVRMLRIYLGATTFLYLYGVVFTLFPVRTDLTYANPRGGIVAIVLGVSALISLAVRPDRLGLVTVAAMFATPIVMAFHVSLTAEYVCLIAPMFLAMYLRAFHPPRQALLAITALIAACIVAVVVSPAPHLGVITLLIIAIAISGAAESFGLLMRATFVAACTDPLTGLLNRAGWEIGIADLLVRSKNTATSVTVLALDIDGLKAINDTFGHAAGDQRIVDYAHRWIRAAPGGAVLARLGGDEFAACIVDADPATVEEFLDDIRRNTPGVSVGTVTDDSRNASVAELLTRADAALYRGRGRPLHDDRG